MMTRWKIIQRNWKYERRDRSFADIALWLNGELMKNAAEIGYGRFLYAAGRKENQGK